MLLRLREFPWGPAGPNRTANPLVLSQACHKHKFAAMRAKKEFVIGMLLYLSLMSADCVSDSSHSR